MFSYDCGKAFIETDVSRIICAISEWLHWIKLFRAIFLEPKTLQSLLNN